MRVRHPIPQEMMIGGMADEDMAETVAVAKIFNEASSIIVGSACVKVSPQVNQSITVQTFHFR